MVYSSKKKPGIHGRWKWSKHSIKSNHKDWILGYNSYVHQACANNFTRQCTMFLFCLIFRVDEFTVEWAQLSAAHSLSKKFHCTLDFFLYGLHDFQNTLSGYIRWNQMKYFNGRIHCVMHINHFWTSASFKCLL